MKKQKLWIRKYIVSEMKLIKDFNMKKWVKIQIQSLILQA